MEQRLQKLIAAAGVASRRHAEELISAGRVTVNGEVIKELGSKADPDKDHIKVNGKLINPQLQSREKVYVLLNKPKGYLSSVSDPEGLLLLTNDGDFTNYVTAARNRVEKVYEVKVKGVPAESGIQRLRRGVTLEDGTRTAPAKITKLNETQTNAWYEVLLHQGRNQQVRRMFELIGHSVLKLRRVRIGFLMDEKLKPGSWRFLSPAEASKLMRNKTTQQKSHKKAQKAQKS